ncbi:MAG: EAL domain-containing protein [Gemmatimonadota bacterium]
MTPKLDRAGQSSAVTVPPTHGAASAGVDLAAIANLCVRLLDAIPGRAAAVAREAAACHQADQQEIERLAGRVKSSEALYEELVESAGDILYRADPEGCFTYANPAAVHITGYPRDELTGMHFTDLVRPDFRDRMVALYLAQIESATEISYFEFPVVTKDRREVWIGQNVKLLRADEGISGVQAVARDITAMRHARTALQESEERFRKVAESLGEGIVITDHRDVITYVNSPVCEMSGRDPEELIGRNAGEVLLPADRRQAVRDSARVGGLPGRYQVRRPHRDGRQVWIEVNAVPFQASNEPAIGTLALLQDVTARKEAEEENLRLAALSRENPNPILECGASGEPIRYNEAVARMVELLCLPGPRSLLPQDHAALVTSCLERNQEHGNIEVEVGGRTLAWTYHPYHRARTVHLFATDVTNRRVIEQKLRHDALHDALTGLPNRMLFMERLRHTALRVKRHPEALFAVLFLDLDRFKVINDSLGHHVGDELLGIVAKRLQACLRPMDTVARLGGDEFAILLDDVHEAADATRISERIQRELSIPLKLSGFEVVTSASIGIALSSIGYEDPEFLLRNADLAMYRAKAEGHARIEIFDRMMHADALARLQLENDIRTGIERGEFKLHFQPILCLAENRIVAAEALIRWEHPTRGLLQPDEFVSVAEEAGLIAPLGRWVLREACLRAHGWRRRFTAYGRLGISINLSAKQLAHVDLVGEVRAALDDSGLEASALKLEITESAVMARAEDAVVLLADLKRLGVKLHVDDFGTGYSSLSYLHRFPLDALKIDRSFIGRMADDGLTLRLVETLIELARGIGVDVIAEGVETAEQFALLRDLKCRMGQGHLFAEPLPAEAFEALLADSSAAGLDELRQNRNL